MSQTPDDPFAQQPGSNPQPDFGQQQPQHVQPDYGQQPQYAQPQYAQPQYGQAPYPPPNHGPRPGTEKNWMGITSLVMSLAGLLTGISVIAGIVFGHMSLRAVKKGQADNRGMGLAGLIIGYVFLILSILGIAAFVIFFVWLDSECGGSNPADWCGESNSTSWEWEYRRP